MELLKIQKDEELVLALTGNLDLETYRELNDSLEDVNPSSHVIIDLANIGFINSSGVGTLMRFFHGVSAAGGVCNFRNVPPHVLKVFRLLGLEENFGITVESGLS